MAHRFGVRDANANVYVPIDNGATLISARNIVSVRKMFYLDQCHVVVYPVGANGYSITFEYAKEEKQKCIKLFHLFEAAMGGVK